ncbi:MAG: hypothetical protein KA419_03785 [Acidobacteria bacterium]|nr:hypothetical protein [Acidobacteriota bacterium]
MSSVPVPAWSGTCRPPARRLAWPWWVATLALCFMTGIAGPTGEAGDAAAGDTVVCREAVSWVESAGAVPPSAGTGTCAAKPNAGHYLTMFVPGQLRDDGANCTGIQGSKYFSAFATGAGPVQSTDWWTGAGLQWSGWVERSPDDKLVRTKSFFSEPLEFAFLDLPVKTGGAPVAIHGLHCANLRELPVRTSSDPAVPYTSQEVAYGNVSPALNPVVTVGLDGVHPVSAQTPAVPATPPYDNVRVKSYSDWGLVLTYADGGSSLDITLANGSPCVWFQRTAGTAPFTAWAGVIASPGAVTVWKNQGSALGLTVTFNVQSAGGTFPNTSSYALLADQGAWTPADHSDTPARPLFAFSNPQATKVVLVAMPHNTESATDLDAALTVLAPHAWQRIAGTRLHYPPISGSDMTVEVGGVTKILGYDQPNAVLRTLHRVTTEAFDTGGAGGDALQLVFPHHRKAMVAEDRARIQAQYAWRSTSGELQAFVGNQYVRELRTRGLLPFLPGACFSGAAPVNGKMPAADVYDGVKTWLYQGELKPDGTRSPIISDLEQLGTVGGNTYIPGWAALIETLPIADQLANAADLAGWDTDFNLPKTAVAAQMRDFLLDSLEGLVSRWFDAYQAGTFQYNPEFNAFYGWPDGFQSVQSFTDHHFHWNYFLRAAACIGRYDPHWLELNLPLIEELQQDSANYDRANTRYPFLRNFSVFHGHNWADGTANGGVGNNQESLGEALSFAAGLASLGQAAGKPEWTELGLYLYEEEVLAGEQYWFNQDANLDAGSGTFFNGNWPDAYVRYQKNGQPRLNCFAGTVSQTSVSRRTFWSSGYEDYANSILIQAIPLSASSLYISRNPQWLGRVWSEMMVEAADDPNTNKPEYVYNVLYAGLQAQLAGTGASRTDPGPPGALTRAVEPHMPFMGAWKHQGIYWAYNLLRLGRVDATVVADTPAFGVFVKDGTRSFVAYNPGPTPVTVRFRTADTGADVTSFPVPPGSMATKIGTAPLLVEHVGPPPAPDNRLFLRKTAGLGLPCDAAAKPVENLSTTPGAWTIGDQSFPFPADHATRLAKVENSLACLPQAGNAVYPGAALVRAWTGTFWGKVTRNPYTRFSLCTDSALTPFWFHDPSMTRNNLSFRVSYDFDSDGTPDRVETYVNAAMDNSNTFTYKNRVTENQFDVVWPLKHKGVSIDQDRSAGFPDVIPQAHPATVTLEIWGGTDQAGAIYISCEADPATGRASWVQPPYAQPVETRRVLYCPHTASGSGWKTWLHLVNGSDAPDAVTLKAYDAQGVLKETNVVTIPGKGAFSGEMAAVFTGPGTAAANPWLSIEGGTSLTGAVRYVFSEAKDAPAGSESVKGDMVLPLAESPDTALVFPVAWEDQTVTQKPYTGLALTNPNPVPATVTVKAFAGNGGLVGTKTLGIPAMGSLARLLSEIFPRPDYHLDDADSVTVQADQPLLGWEVLGFLNLPGSMALPTVGQNATTSAGPFQLLPDLNTTDYNTELAFLNLGRDPAVFIVNWVLAVSGNAAATKIYDNPLVETCGQRGGPLKTLFPAADTLPAGYLRLACPVSEPATAVEILYAGFSSKADSYALARTLGSPAVRGGPPVRRALLRAAAAQFAQTLPPDDDGAFTLRFPLLVTDPAWAGTLNLINVGSRDGAAYDLKLYDAAGAVVGGATGTLGAHKAVTVDLSSLGGWAGAVWMELSSANGTLSAEYRAVHKTGTVTDKLLVYLGM